jgi:predicted type IV restriction endonuclease
MIELLERIAERLQSSAYVNEAAITHGVVTPLLKELGWDTADPRQFVPEFANARGRVDFALIGLGQRPAIFVEVKQVGRANDGDRQLFEYSFHLGVPLCVLTDGREWSFYLPSGQGSYDDRRVYRLQLDDRSPAEAEQVLRRYLLREAVLDQSAFENARRDHQAIAGKREALAILPRAWAELVAEGHELLVETLVDKAEALSGYAPSGADALAFLHTLRPGSISDGTIVTPRLSRTANQGERATSELKTQPSASAPADRSVRYVLFGEEHFCANASVALTEVLRAIVKRDPARIIELSEAVGSRKRNHIARSPLEISPHRPDLARAAEIAPGWLVGLNIANRDKMMIIRAACRLFDLAIPGDLEIELPNG